VNIPLVRAQHLIHYIKVLRDTGVAVERQLERSRLPVYIEQNPNDYVSLPRALDWIWRSSRELASMEIGFIASRGMSIGTLHPDLQRAVIRAPTGFARVAALFNHVHRENSILKIGFRREGADVRVVCEMKGFQTEPFVGFAEWISIAGIINILRSAAGPNWCPDEITFTSRGQPSDATLDAYGNTRILTSQRYSSVLVAATVLAQTCSDHQFNSDDISGAVIHPRTPSGLGEAWDFVNTLRAIIRPYLSQGHPHLSLAAELAGMSERTLQRRLAEGGSTYSQIVQEARFSIASDLLADLQLNISDIAFAAGYDNAPHFSRAFKRLTGITPRDCRRGLLKNLEQTQQGARI